MKFAGRTLCRHFSAINVFMASINVRTASSASNPVHTDAFKIMEASVASVSPPSLVNAALSFDRGTLTLRAGDSATYSINKYLTV